LRPRQQRDQPNLFRRHPRHHQHLGPPGPVDRRGPLDGLTVTNTYDKFLRRTNLTAQTATSILSSTAYGYVAACRLQTVNAGHQKPSFPVAKPGRARLPLKRLRRPTRPDLAPPVGAPLAIFPATAPLRFLACPLIRDLFPYAGGQAKRSAPLTAKKWPSERGGIRSGQASCQDPRP